MALVYKVLGASEWADALRAGAFGGSAVDLRDGFIHLSAGEQVGRTVELYFADRDNLVLIAIDAERLGPALVWEPSRGGALFPHLYAPLRVELAAWAHAFSSRDEGALDRLLAQ